VKHSGALLTVEVQGRKCNEGEPLASSFGCLLLIGGWLLLLVLVGGGLRSRWLGLANGLLRRGSGLLGALGGNSGLASLLLLLGNGGGHLANFSLGTDVCPQASFGEFGGTLLRIVATAFE